MRLLKAVFMPLGMYTRFSLISKKDSSVPAKYVLMGLIWSGFLIGILWRVLHLALTALNVPLMAFAARMCAFPFWFTRYIHLEGFMDTAALINSSKAGYSSENRRGIFGMFSLVLLMILNFAGIYCFLDFKENLWLLIFIPLVSRELAVLMIFSSPLIMENKDGHKLPYNGKILIVLLIVFILTALVCSALCGTRGAIAIIAMLFCFIFSADVLKNFSEAGGDAASYAITISETVGLIALAAIKF